MADNSPKTYIQGTYDFVVIDSQSDADISAKYFKCLDRMTKRGDRIELLNVILDCDNRFAEIVNIRIATGNSQIVLFVHYFNK